MLLGHKIQTKLSIYRETVYRLFYRVTLSDALLSGRDFSLPFDLLVRHLRVQAASGAPYELFTGSMAGLRRLGAAFSLHLSRSVQSADVQPVLAGLSAVWAAARQDLSRVTADTAFEEELLTETG